MEEQRLLTILKFDNKDITILGTNEDPWFIANEIGEIFKMKNIHKILASIPNNLKDTYKIKTKGGSQKARIINKDGLKIVISQTRKYVDKNFLNILKDNFNINFDILFFKKETFYIKTIQLCFNHIISYTEYMIGIYRVDLLFPKEKLVIECDEFNHTKYNKENEVERERYIRDEGYDFVRFNPDETDFNIGKIVNQIMKKIYNIE